MGRRVICDIETNDLYNPTTIWCIVCKDIEDESVHSFHGTLIEKFHEFHETVDEYIGHNFLTFDRVWLKELLGLNIDNKKVTDTLILSHLLKFNIEGGHSLEAWGTRLGIPKVGLDLDFSVYTPGILERCQQDVEINYKLYKVLEKKLISRPEFSKAVEVEHQIALVCEDMHKNGFKFDFDKATALAKEIEDKLADIDAGLLEAFPPRSKLIREVTPRLTKHGTISRVGLPRDWVDLSVVSAGAPFSLVSFEPFNPTSPKQVVDRLNEAGWKPVEKTKGHIEALQNSKVSEEKRKVYNNYGWKLSENNLATLPDTAPPATKRLVERLLLEGRRRTLNEWFQNCQLEIRINDDDIKRIGSESTISLIKSLSENGEEHTSQSIGKKIKKLLERQADFTQLNIKSGLSLTASKIFTVLIKTVLARCLRNVKDVAQYVEETKHLWWITATEQDAFVGCYASHAMQSLGGGSSISNLSSYTSTIRGSFNHIGTWTHRMSHNNPNLGNVAAPKSIKYKTPDLARQATEYGKAMRSLWTVPTCGDGNTDTWLVGTDAVGIQLRIFAHYINDPQFIHAVTQGTKENGDDPHTLNANILGCDRDTAKTFIYAFLLGAGDAKIAEILGVSSRAGRAAKGSFVEAYPGLAKLRREIIPRDAARGFFQSFDGRLVVCDSEHLMMAGYLQTGEACIMKHANILWRRELDGLKETYKQEGKVFDYQQVNFVHDEWQTYVLGDKGQAEEVGEIQAKAIRDCGELFKLRCPMAGDSRVGRNWYETH